MTFGINKKQSFLVLLDAISVIVALFCALLLRFDGEIPAIYFLRYQQAVFVFVPIALIVFTIFGLYRYLWQFASMDEFSKIMFAVTTASALSFLYTRVADLAMPRSVYVIDWVLTLLFVGGVRLLLRVLSRPKYQCSIKNAVTNVLIVGAGAAGALVVTELQKHFNVRKMRPIGLIDDSLDKQGCMIHGVKILGSRNDIPELVIQHQVDEVIIAIPSAPRSEIREIARLCSQASVNTKILPSVYDIIQGNVSISEIRPVQIEDLLGREEVKVDLEEIWKYLTGEIVLVTGAGGSIGSELCRQIAGLQPSNLILLDHAESNVYDIDMEIRKLYPNCNLTPIVSDVRNAERVEAIFQKFNPGVIFHAAAYKHVPLMEANREEAIINNVIGTQNVAEAAHRNNAKRFLLISTDKAVNPTSIMGATKRVAEIIIQSLAKKSATHFCAVRFGNVLGSRGSVIPLFKQQISEGGPVTITHPDMTRYFMTIPEAVQLVIQAGAMGKQGEIFVLDMGEPIRILDLAYDLIRLSGFEPDSDIKLAFTGIRPGEKIFEEMLTSEEGTKSTKHERIFIAKATDQNGISFCREITELSHLLGLDLTSYGGQIQVVCLENDFDYTRNAIQIK